ncbi:FAD-dependent oxidoreductase [Rhizobium sp. CSW-27]|uniref:NAD(P)/FAD-dependent oxidoreductase n=1 Tax=Rhizobium sp. CSW-27 TaxID=2839985 RepID=UPI001C02C862|nr:FAD-dependent oxidoreductase [Rhizobium sp. CSW-27]
MSDNIVIIGGGQAAFSLAAKLRALKDARPITLVSAEAVPPYQRPPLSKKYLLGEMDFSRLLLRPQAWYDENGVDLRLATFAEEIDCAARIVRLQDGTRLSYGTLVLATGAAPRNLPAALGGDLSGVHVMRDKRDADHLSGELQAGRRVLIIGGGYIGLEAAAVARHKGLDVTLIEMADRILKRVASAQTADILRGVHQAHGVSIRESMGLVRLIGRDGHVCGAELSDGSTIEIDLVIVGIGVVANDQLAKAAGLEVANGVSVDAFGRTSDSAIYAVGDCTELPYGEGRVRLESVQNAVDQAESAALAIFGTPVPYQPKPWFWSDQYDVKLQIAGLNQGYDETLVRPGAREGSASIWYFRAGRFIAVDAVNDAKAYVTGKKLLELGIQPERAILADAAADLKLLLA